MASHRGRPAAAAIAAGLAQAGGLELRRLDGLVAASAPPASCRSGGATTCSIGTGDREGRGRLPGQASRPPGQCRGPGPSSGGRASPALVATVVLSLRLGAGFPAWCTWSTCRLRVGLQPGLKTTAWSWLPYADGLRRAARVRRSWRTGTPTTSGSGCPPWWATLGLGAMLGVGAHLVNALPDLADDEATGVRGLPHRLGARRWRGWRACCWSVRPSWSRSMRPSTRGRCCGCSWGRGRAGVVALVGSGRSPSRAAVGIALLDVVALVWVL